MSELRNMLLPYGMAKNADGTWTFFNRKYKPVGVISAGWAEWDDPRHKVKFKRDLPVATLRKLDIRDEGNGERIYFYDDGCVPTHSAKTMAAYLERLNILMNIEIQDMG